MRKIYRHIPIISYVGEYKLKHSRLVLDLYKLEDVDKALAEEVSKRIKAKFNITDEFSDIYSINGTSDKLNTIALENAKYLLDTLDEGIGADDGHYDYFPDLVEQFRQLCEQTDNQALYNRTVEQVKKHRQYNDEDEEVEFDLL